MRVTRARCCLRGWGCLEFVVIHGPTRGIAQLLLHTKEPNRFGRATLRWHGRYCREVPDVDLDEGQAVLAALCALRGPRKAAAARALAELLTVVVSHGR
jgi:hypothetical protein